MDTNLDYLLTRLDKISREILEIGEKLPEPNWRYYSAFYSIQQSIKHLTFPKSISEPLFTEVLGISFNKVYKYRELRYERDVKSICISKQSLPKQPDKYFLKLYDSYGYSQRIITKEQFINDYYPHIVFRTYTRSLPWVI